MVVSSVGESCVDQAPCDCDKITLNLHLSLHLCECAYDYGPLYALWCFSFERMNGILGIVFFVSCLKKC